MPTFNNIPSNIRKNLLTPIDLTQGTALLRSNLRNIANSLSNVNGYKSFLRQELRSLMHPRENGFLGLVATNNVNDISIDLVGNPIPKIIFGGTYVDIAVVFNQDAFRIVLEKDASADGATVAGWILAVIPYTPFDKLTFGGFLIYLLRRIDDILSKTAALTRYDNKLVRLPVNSVGIGRNDRAPEAPDEAAIAQPPQPIEAPEVAQAPAPIEKPKPEPVIPEQPLEDEPEVEDVDTKSKEYKAAASFSLSPDLQESTTPKHPYDAVGNYATFFQVLKSNLSAVRKELAKLSGNTSASVKLDKSAIVFTVQNVRDPQLSLLTSISLLPIGQLNLGKNKGPRFEVTGVLDTTYYDGELEEDVGNVTHVSVGTWKWLAEYGRLNTLQLVNKIVADLLEATTHVEHAANTNSDAAIETESEATAADKTKHPKLPTEVKVPESKTEVETYKKKLAEIRKKSEKKGTDTSAYNKIENKTPKAKTGKELSSEINVPEVPDSGATTVADKIKDSLEEAPKVKLPKNAAILPKVVQAAEEKTPIKLLPLNKWNHKNADHYIYQPGGHDWNGNSSVISINRDPDSNSWYVRLNNISKQFKQLVGSFVEPVASIVNGQLVDHNGQGDAFESPEAAYEGLLSALNTALYGNEATAKEFDEDYTADSLTDLELNDMDTDFADTDKSLEDPNDVVEGAADGDEAASEPPATPAEPESLETSDGDEEKVDINTALKFRAVLPEDADAELPSKLTELFDAISDGKVPEDTVIFVTSGTGLRTYTVGKNEDDSVSLRCEYSDALILDGMAGTLDDTEVTKTLDKAKSEQEDRSASLRNIDEIFDAFETIVKEDTFDPQNFNDTADGDDGGYTLPSDRDRLDADLADYAKKSSDDAEAETDEEPSEEEEADAAFASALVDLLHYKENPVAAAAEVNAIIHAFSGDAEAAFSLIEDKGLFANASTFPVMETKFYKRGARQYPAYHMSVASTTEPTLMFVPRTGAYAIASLEELQSEEARG